MKFTVEREGENDGKIYLPLLNLPILGYNDGLITLFLQLLCQQCLLEAHNFHFHYPPTLIERQNLIRLLGRIRRPSGVLGDWIRISSIHWLLLRLISSSRVCGSGTITTITKANFSKVGGRELSSE